MIRILVVDDHRIFRQGIHALLMTAPDIMVAGEGRDGRDAIEITEQLQPDVILMDIEMPNMDGLEATRYLASCPAHPKILIISMRTEERDVVRAAQAGARGYLVKNCSREELVDAIRAVYEGRTACSPEVAAFFPRQMGETETIS